MNKSGRMTFRFEPDKAAAKHEPAVPLSGGVVANAGAGVRMVRRDQEEDRLLDGDAYYGYENEDYGRIPERKVQEEPVEAEFTAYSGYSEGELSRRHQPARQSFYTEPAADLWDSASYDSGAEEPEDRLYPLEDWGQDRTGGGGYERHSGGYGGAYHSRRPSRWWKVTLSVAGALGTGLLLGYTALSFFGGISGGADSAERAAGTSSVQSGAAGAGQTAAGGAVLPGGAGMAGAGRIQVAVPAQSYYLLQYGVFSTAQGAEQAQQELMSAGLAAGADPEGGNRVYAGLSPDREEAKLLSSGLKNQGIELYVREVSLPAVQQAAFAGEAETVKEYFAASGELLGELSSLSAGLLGGAGSPADAASVSDLHMRWSEAAKALAAGLGPEEQVLCAALEKAANRAVAALNEYDKNAAQALLWEVQDSMLTFLNGQRQLLAALS
ncbi:SPOR domain-containing protein [Paenibacillus tepidiphilus]|uniref:SPOR domain-containing protein n=1 Tax=Paenibacillus tepidiphilus TaxID=2608683 RepID=UPI001239F431|nr:SPOR domain-containing protein [Paenibacillus tepidiphilus]